MLLNEILKIERKYHKNISYIDDEKTWINLELETKINITTPYDVKNVLDKIKDKEYTECTHRTEWHHFFSNNGITHTVLILVEQSNEIWIKTKKDRKVVYTPKCLPLLLRHEIKVKPTDHNYKDEFMRTITSKYIGSIKKECIDHCFFFRDLNFAITLSLADTIPANNSLYQIEFEYTGHRIGTRKPSYKKVLKTFEDMLIEVLDKDISRLNTHAKIEWLYQQKNFTSK